MWNEERKKLGSHPGVRPAADWLMDGLVSKQRRELMFEGCDLQVDRESLMASNRSLAEESLQHRPRLHHGKVLLAEKYLELSNLATACWEKHSRLVQKQSLQTAQNLLQEEVERAEERSESFMEGNASVDSFLDSFQSSRKSYHVRRAQAEKLQELVERRGQGGRTPRTEEEGIHEEKKDWDRPNGVLPHPQGPLRVFKVRYGLTPAILLPHYPVSPPPSAPSPSDPSQGHAHVLSPSGERPPAHGQPVGLRVIGHLPGGWAGANGRPVRVQQLYRPRPHPHQPEPPFR
uniref:Si:ch211-284f22.3 n=1 Tax=Gouania willdenowi TaxID=441366 RepID=A0A8C5E895_GOUWI